jgi:eukaryotic translation initiation factor 2C
LILKKKDTAAYSIFKDLADRCYGVHALCLTEGVNWTQKNGGSLEALQSYFGNIVMKLNLKMGGVNQSVAVGNLYGTTLVLGADVTHPSSGAISGCPSIAAIVGSVGSLRAYRGSMRLQDRENKEVGVPRSSCAVLPLTNLR